MENYIKFHYLKHLLVFLLLVFCGNTISLTGATQPPLQCQGDYFIFSDDHHYIFGNGNILLKTQNNTIKGDVLYFDVQQNCGLLYGHITLETGNSNNPCQALFFKVFPFSCLKMQWAETLTLEGDTTLTPLFDAFLKRAPEQLKTSSVFFEFREFSIDANQKIKAKIVIPYMMGMPTPPLRALTVNRGQRAEKTLLDFNHVNYTDSEGLALVFFLRLREKWVAGDFDVKFYERALFKMENPKRGILLSGENNFFPTTKQKNLLSLTTLLNSGEQSYNLVFKHGVELPFLRYTLAQTFSGRENQRTFAEFRSDFTLKKLKYILPRLDLTTDWKKSFFYGLSTPLHLWKKLNINLSWQRRIINDSYRSDTADFSTALSFDAGLFSLGSNYNYSKNWVEMQVRQNFAATIKLKPLRFLEDNISFDIGTFYMFSTLPMGTSSVSRITPGITLGIRSFGAILPWGLRLVPGFGLNHLWDNRDINMTDFNYTVALRKQMGHFSASLDYALTSRYRSHHFWVEGNNRQSLNLNLELEEPSKNTYLLLLRFYCNDKLAIENISLNGKWLLPYDLSLSCFLLYYNQEHKFQTCEIFLEKSFNKKIKIQGGYSLALKRFFIKCISQ